MITRETIERIRKNRQAEPWKTFYGSVEKLCNGLLQESPPRSDITRTSWMLVKARFMQRALVSLAGFYRITGDEKYAEKAVVLLEDLIGWDSWCMNGQGGADEFFYDLATAELAVALRFTLEWMDGYIAGEMRQKLYRIIEERIMEPFISLAAPADGKRGAWWYNGVTNWNSVCSGGAACLAYYLAEQSELAKEVILLAEKSLDTYVRHMHEDGSNEEGISYWMYGMMFLLYYYFSYEAKTGKKHEAYGLPAMKNGLKFFFDLTVREGHISFSDNGETTPVGILYALAEGVEDRQQARQLTYRFMELREVLADPPLYSEIPTHVFWVQWPSEIFMLLLCPDYCRVTDSELFSREPLVIYPSNGWGVFSSNRLVLSFRSGTTKENHAMHDLNSIQLAAGGTILLQDMRGNPYPVGWFGRTRELFNENNTQGKNSMLVNGIGQLTYDDAEWGYDSRSMWSDAKAAYPDFARAIKRKVSLEGDKFVIEDEFSTSSHTWHEIRFITYGEFTELGNCKWLVKKGEASALLEFSADIDIECLVCDMPVSIAVRDMPRMLRVFTSKRLLTSKFITVIS